MAHRGRWAAVRSLVAWRGPGKKQTRHDRPRPHARCPRGPHCHPSLSHAQRQARPQAAVVRPPVPTERPVHTGGWSVSPLLRTGPAWWVSGARPCWRPRTHLGPVSCPRHRAHGCGAGGAPSCAGGGPACPSVRVGGRLGQGVAIGDAVRVGSQQRPARPGASHAAGRSSRARGRHVGCPLGRSPCQPTSPKAHQAVHAWVAAVGPRAGRAPASVPSTPTRACRRPLPASAPTSLRLPAAPEA